MNIIQQLLIEKKKIDRIKESARDDMDKTPLAKTVYQEADEAHSDVINLISRTLKLQGRLN